MSKTFIQEPSITVTSAAVRLDLLWPEFKKYLDGTYKLLHIQFLETADHYQVFCIDGGIVYVCTILQNPSTYEETFSTPELVAEHEGYKAEFEAKYKPRANRGTPTTADGRPRIAIEKTTASKTTFFSHDWADPTTWYETAERVVGEVLQDSGDHTVYAFSHSNIIDTYHGKITQEDFLKDAGGHSYRVTVKVNGSPKVEQDPHFAAGGDYFINYAEGKLTFLAPLDESDVVTATYHRMVNSQFTIRPSPGKQVAIECAEVQFSADVTLTDSAVFQAYGYVDVFAPQLAGNGPGQIPSGTKIPLGSPVVYKTMTDYQNDAFKAYSTYPAMGGNGWRGCPQPILVMDWDYRSSTYLRSDYGMEIRIRLQHDTPFGGYYATATFYGVVDDIP